jgi:hypothetical protein
MSKKNGDEVLQRKRMMENAILSVLVRLIALNFRRTDGKVGNDVNY